MSATGIEWTDKTWNPVTGCAKVSEGCRNCYAEVMAKRTFGRLYPPVYDKHPDTKNDAGPLRLTEVLGRSRRFTDVQCHPDRLDAPLRWRKPSKVFVNSMSDLFHPDVPNEFIDRVFAVMAYASFRWGHQFQVLTKRPDRMRAYLADGRQLRVCEALGGLAAEWGQTQREAGESARAACLNWPLPDVWLGTSIEDQPTADARIPEVLATPAAVRFVSYEPALGPVDFEAVPLPWPGCSTYGLRGVLAPVALKETEPDDWKYWTRVQGRLNWVIVGGESGPKARLCDVAWIRSVVEQCKAAGTPCFVKQLGANVRSRVRLRDPKGGDPAEWPEDLRVRQWPEVQ